MRNLETRFRIQEMGVCLWEIAEELHVSEPTMTRLLRRTLTDNEKAELLEAAKRVAKRKGGSTSNEGTE